MIGEQFSANGKGPITVLNCLLHNAGFPPDPNPNYCTTTYASRASRTTTTTTMLMRLLTGDPAFNCPETSKPYPAENFSCQTKIYNSVMNQTLQYPINTGMVYSDLSFITLMYVVGHLAREHNYVSKDDIVPGCDTGGPGCVIAIVLPSATAAIKHDGKD